MGRNNTQFFQVVKEQEYNVASILKDVYEALKEKAIIRSIRLSVILCPETRRILPVIKMPEV